MKKHKTFEEYTNKLREMSGIKTDEDIFKKLNFELEQLHPKLSEEELKKIDESSLTRIRQHILEHDISTITAFRIQDTDCINGQNTGKFFTKKENLERNNKLRSALLKLDYGITEIDGIRRKGKLIVKEDSFLVVNLNNDEKFINNMIKLGQYYCQDSILLKEKDKEDAYLIGTNYSKDPGLNNKVQLGKFKPGLENDFMSKIRGRPFYFEEYDNCSINTCRIITQESKEILNEILNEKN